MKPKPPHFFSRFPLENAHLSKIKNQVFATHGPQTSPPTDALQKYMGSGFSAMNRFLRSGGTHPEVLFDEFVKEIDDKCRTSKSKLGAKKIYLNLCNRPIRLINDLDAVFNAHSRLPLSATLFRGVHNYVADHDIGDDLFFPEFLSTTLSPRIAWAFTFSASGPGALFVFHAHAAHAHAHAHGHGHHMADNKPTPAAVMPSLDRSELEVLIQRGTHWKVIRKYVTGMTEREGKDMADLLNMYGRTAAQVAVPVFELQFASVDKSKHVKLVKDTTSPLIVGDIIWK